EAFGYPDHVGDAVLDSLETTADENARRRAAGVDLRERKIVFGIDDPAERQSGQELIQLPALIACRLAGQRSKLCLDRAAVLRDPFLCGRAHLLGALVHAEAD